METGGIALLFVCMLAAVYLGLQWLVALLAVLLLLIAIGSMGAPKKVAAVAKAPEEIIYPVIYEDVGEPPFLYHPETRIEVNPTWEPRTQWWSASSGVGKLLGGGVKLLKGKGKKEE